MPATISISDCSIIASICASIGKGCCPSASIIATISPLAAASPALSAGSLPKLRDKRMISNSVFDGRVVIKSVTTLTE